ncbi:MAG: SWIM zinc finger family protein, partial [Saprospiraceae bacterium]|nr:SWIM zinc finger family protein [Saprospiraceae bacterium]
MKNFSTIPALNIQDVFGQTTYLKGKHYFHQNRVIWFEATAETANTIILGARVKGSNDQQYHQTIAIAKRGHYPNINGRCSCPVGYNCKHVVAAYLAYKAGNIQQNNSQHQVSPGTAYINWLSSLNETGKQLDTTRDFVAYILRKRDTDGKFLLSLFSTREKKQGGLAVGRNIPLSNIRYGYFTNNFKTPEDLELFRLVSGLEENYGNTALIMGALGHLVLSKALQCGRLFWNSHQFAPPLSEGEPRTLELSWVTQKDGAYRLNAAVTNNAMLLPTEPPLYLDEQNSTLGIVDCANLTHRQYQRILSAPPLPIEYVEDFSQRLVIDHPDIPLPPPKPVQVTELNGLSPRPRLQLLGQQLDDSYIHLLKLRFDYGDHTLSAL